MGRVGETTLIEIGTGAFTLVAITLAYVLGELHRQRADAAERDRQLAAHKRRLAVHSITLHAIAEDYDPADEDEETPEERRRRFYVVEGGKGAGAIALAAIATLSAAASRHRRAATAFALAAGTTAVIATALLGHPGAAHHALLGRHPTATHTIGTAYTTAPTTRPHPSHSRTMPLLPVVPLRSRRPGTTPTPAASAPPDPSVPSAPSPTAAQTKPRPSRSPSPPQPTPTPSVSAGCPIGLTLRVIGVGVTICV